MRNISAFLLSLSIFQILWAQTLKISAEKFQSNQKTGISTLTGNVKIQKGNDSMSADKVEIFTNNDRKLVKFKAVGKVIFTIQTRDGRTMKGQSSELLYVTKSNIYTLKGKAAVKEEGSINELKGEEIILNQESGQISVAGSKEAPAGLIFTLEK